MDECLTGDSQIKEEFGRYFSQLLDLPLEKVKDMEIRPGSVIVDLNAAEWSLDERNGFVSSVTASTAQLPKETEVTIHPLFRSCIIDIAIFDKRGNKSDFAGHNWSMGPDGAKRTYYQPPGGHGWTRYGLNAIGKYSDGNGWLMPFHSPENWWRAYHGTDMDGMQGIGTDGVIRESIMGKMGKGVYVTPHIEYAACYAQPFESNNRKFIFIFQCAVKPREILSEGYPGSHDFGGFPGLKGIFKSRYGQTNSEWTYASNNVRPYGIIIGDVEQLERIYGEQAIGHKRRQMLGHSPRATTNSPRATTTSPRAATASPRAASMATSTPAHRTGPTTGRRSSGSEASSASSPATTSSCQSPRAASMATSTPAHETTVKRFSGPEASSASSPGITSCSTPCCTIG
jgi:hypothetical protein